MCLLHDLFDGDETFKFKKTCYKRGLCFVFENDQEKEVEFIMTQDYIWIP